MWPDGGSDKLTARVLIVDGVDRNRSLLKVGLQSAQFAVSACATEAEARCAMARDRPDVVLVNLNDPSQELHGFCRKLRDSGATDSIALIAVGIPDTAKARFAALDAGADDVVVHPVDGSFLTARVRSLLRLRRAVPQDEVRGKYGFEDGRKGFAAKPRIVVLTATGLHPPEITFGLHERLGCIVERDARAASPANLTVLVAADASGLRMQLSEVRRNAGHGPVLAILPRSVWHDAARCLELDLQDLCHDGVTAGELALRAGRLLALRPDRPANAVSAA